MLIKLLTLPFNFFYHLAKRAYKIKARYYSTLSESSFDYVSKELGYLVIVDGPIRCGKTTLCSILVNYLIRYIDEMAMRDMHYCKRVCSLVDFDQINQLIDDELAAGSVNYFEIAIHLLANPDFDVRTIEGYHDTGYRLVSRKDYFCKYIEAYAAYSKKDYCRCNVDFTDRVFNKKAKYLDIEDFFIKRLFPTDLESLEDLRKKKYQYNLSRYCVYFLDDISIYDQLNSLNSQEFKGSKTGFSQTWRLFGQILEETGFIVANSQRAGRVVKEAREIMTTYLHIENHNTKVNYSGCIKVLDFKLKFQNFLIKFHKKKVDKLDYRLADYKILLQQELLKAGRYLSFEVTKRNLDPDLSVIEDLNRVKLVAPSIYGYGCTDTHYFSFLHEFFLSFKAAELEDIDTQADLDSYINGKLSGLPDGKQLTFCSFMVNTDDRKIKKKKSNPDYDVGDVPDYENFCP